MAETSPALVAAARNTNTVAEGENIMMSNEQLQQALQGVSEDLDKLANSEKPLTKEEEKYRKKLVMRKYVLDKIKEAKEKKHKDDELYNSTVYDLLVPWGENHPILMNLMMRLMKTKWWGVST